LELELGLATLGNVAGDLGKTDELVVLPDRIDDDTGPEEGAILADAPALFFGDLEGAKRLAVGAVRFGVEAGKMPADDLLRRIALDPLPADVPARDDARWVEHIKRVVGHTLDQKPA